MPFLEFPTPMGCRDGVNALNPLLDFGFPWLDLGLSSSLFFGSEKVFFYFENLLLLVIEDSGRFF